ncbi:MAG: glycine betaine ABC transporter substrate-binding protein [Desulfatirhabdiaceae bacterium]|nr:glycine betaine ABC transporter substrate-binding protein [Desulfatirhabdiaceae bacterium]
MSGMVKKTRKMMCCALAIAIGIVFCGSFAGAADKKLVIGSKNFTEQQILGEIMIQLLDSRGFKCEDKTGLGGTLVARKALENGQIDMYMEYTGTALVTMLKEKDVITDPKACYDFVKKADLERNGLVWLPYMSFNNTYCLLMRREDAAQKKIKTLSDLSAYIKANPTKVRFGTNDEFYARPDGYKPLQKKYDFQFPDDKIIKMAPGLLYKALQDKEIEVSMGFATDGRIKGMNLVILEDDQNYFPVYNPAPVVKKEIAAKYPELEKIFSELSTKLDTQTMTDLNYAVDGEHKPVKDVVAAFLKGAGLVK